MVVRTESLGGQVGKVAYDPYSSLGDSGGSLMKSQ